MKIFIIFSFLALSCVLARALDATNVVIDALPPVAADEKALDSGPLLSAPGEASPTQRGARDPFWPIGYVPPSMRAGTPAPDKIPGATPGKEPVAQGAGLPGMLKIGGVVRKGGKFYATINGFTVQSGEVVTVAVDGTVYKFLIEKIDLKKVQVRPLK